MKVLVCLLHFGYHRNFASVIRELAERGHDVHVAAEKGDRDRAREVLRGLADEYPTVTIGTLPPREKDQYLELAQRLRLSFDYLRYLEPEYRGMPGLRMRSEDRVPVGMLRLLSLPGAMTVPGRRLVRFGLTRLERAIPPSAAIEHYLRDQRPDVMLITPLIGVVTSSQLDYLSIARRLGIPTGFCVWSWDNLSSKALIRDMPDRVFVWNETQKQEAERLHHIPADNVVVTGAQCFDQWFGRGPTRSREEFCRSVGLPPERPYILYAGSTMVWKSPPEAEFVLRWIRHIRNSADARLRDASILVRPHPGRLSEWDGIDVSRLEGVAFSGLSGTANRVGAGYPMDTDSKADYFDALFHSAAVVGINTSAFIEATIIGRPVYAILADEFSGTQSGTIHFRYLTEIGGGAVQAGRAFDEHEAQLAAALAGRADHDDRRRRFLEAFVRPHGLGAPATTRFADAVEALGRLPRRNPAKPAAPPLVARAALDKLAETTRRGRGKLLLMTREEFAAATINERPHQPYLTRVGQRATKRLKRLRKGAAKARKRTVALGFRMAAAARGLVLR